jgi:hypothetical protein
MFANGLSLLFYQLSISLADKRQNRFSVESSLFSLVLSKHAFSKRRVTYKTVFSFMDVSINDPSP